MNTIKGIQDQSDYEGNYDYVNYRIDGYWLDEKLEELYPGNMYKGLIPTLVYWMEIDSEKKVVWDRILPKDNEVAMCPILMCPDDCDFSCTLIIAEIHSFSEVVQWKRIGVDETREWGVEKVGTKVKWFDDFPVLNFRKNDYQKMLDIFQEQCKKDEIIIIEKLNKWRERNN